MLWMALVLINSGAKGNGCLFSGINHCHLSQNQLTGYYKWLWWLWWYEQSLSQLYQRNLQSKQNLFLCSLVVASLSIWRWNWWNTHEQLPNDMDFCGRPVSSPVRRSNIALTIHQLTFWSQPYNSINAMGPSTSYLLTSVTAGSSVREPEVRGDRGGWSSPNVDSHI